jgi:hypothetical protein
MKLALMLLSLLGCTSALAQDAPVIIYGEPGQNAFLPALAELGLPHKVLPLARLAAGPQPGSAVLVVAEACPKPLDLDAAAWKTVAAYLARGTSVYVEYARVPELPAGNVETPRYERIFVTRPGACLGLSPLTLLEEHESSRLPVVPPAGAEVLLAYGRVAGFDRAVFGPPKQSTPALLRLARGESQWFIATTALSNAVRGRYVPSHAWQGLLRQLTLELLPANLRAAARARYAGLRAWTEPRDWVSPGQPLSVVVEAAEGADVRAEAEHAGSIALQPAGPGRWHSAALKLPAGTHTVRLTARRGGREQTADVAVSVSAREPRYRETLRRNTDWFRNAGMLISEDGSRGVREGLASPIAPDGTQAVANCARVDCVSECALAFFLYGLLAQDESWQNAGRNMMKAVTERYQVTSTDTWYYGDWQSRNDYDPEGTTYVFVDDSGAAMTMCFLFYHFTQDPQYLLPALRSAEYFRRTASASTGQIGGASHRNYEGSGPLGRPWARSRASDCRTTSPHVQSWAQAGLLYAYAVTGDRQYYDVAAKGIRYAMEHHKDWHLVTSGSCEHARMLLPLALLYRYEPTPEVKGWIDTVAGYLRAKQDPCGAILEWDGRSPTSNDEFGTGETSIFQVNGDPVSDQLYNTGFALMHLWMAHRITGDQELLRMFEQLGDYLSRIQVRSDNRLLGGTWLRSFDFRRWEYFGSSADVGWGPYCVETGWSCAPIDLGLLFYLRNDDPAPAKAEPPRDVKVGLLHGRVRKEFDDVEAALSQPPPAEVTGLRVAAAGGNYVDLAWDRPAGNGLFFYRVYRGDRAGSVFGPKSPSVVTQDESCLLADLKPGTSYWFRVVAENGCGQASAPSNEVSARTGSSSLARGKRYTKSLRPHPPYADKGDDLSTDGVYGHAYADRLSYGYALSQINASIDLEIVLDLATPQRVSRAMHRACGGTGYKPDLMAIETSVDGKTWRPQGAATKHRSGFLVRDFAGHDARYVKFRFQKKRTGEGDDWLFIGELEVF